MGGVGTFGVVACVQEVAVTPGVLLADVDLIRYTRDASEKDEAIRKAVDFSTTARRQTGRRQRAEGGDADTLTRLNGIPMRLKPRTLCRSCSLPGSHPTESSCSPSSAEPT